MRRLLPTILALVSVFAMAGCGNDGTERMPIVVAAIYAVGEGSELRLLGSTHAKGCTSKVRESAKHVRVALECASKGRRDETCLPSKPCAGVELATVQLKVPVGDREVFDEASGTAPLICKSPQMPAVNAKDCVGAADGDPVPTTPGL